MISIDPIIIAHVSLHTHTENTLSKENTLNTTRPTAGRPAEQQGLCLAICDHSCSVCNGYRVYIQSS